MARPYTQTDKVYLADAEARHAAILRQIPPVLAAHHFDMWDAGTLFNKLTALVDEVRQHYAGVLASSADASLLDAIGLGGDNSAAVNAYAIVLADVVDSRDKMAAVLDAWQTAPVLSWDKSAPNDRVSTPDPPGGTNWGWVALAAAAIVVVVALKI